jgi:amidase
VDFSRHADGKSRDSLSGGPTPEGLPCGVQILGPCLEDATPIDVAGRIAEVTGGFAPPPLT